MSKEKIIFMAPEAKGGPYYVYLRIVNYLNEKYSDTYEFKFCNSKLDWITLHFSKNKCIFSVIPFVFKPIRTEKYIYNPRGNFQKERKEKGLGKKLLYLSSLNLWFSDAIWLVSYFLADTLGFKDKYNHKIQIFPNFIDSSVSSLNGGRTYNDSNFKILTVTSFSFYEKGKGIVNLGKVIQQLGEKTDKSISWTIIGNDGSENFKKIQQEFNTLCFSSNVVINWKGWCSKQEIYDSMKQHDYFLYWTYLDNFPGVILDALAFQMKILVNDFESFGYFLKENIICSSEQEMCNKLLDGDIEVGDANEYKIEAVLLKLYNFIEENGNNKNLK